MPRPPSHQRGRVSSKADDFDVRYRDGQDGGAWGNGADEGYDGGYASDDHGALGGTVDYELSYDANGWDTQGFRSPTADYPDNHQSTDLGSAAWVNQALPASTRGETPWEVRMMP